MSKKPIKKKRTKKRDALKLSDQTRPRREYIDYDYADSLSPEDRQWLARFTDEYYGGKFEFSDEYKKVPDKRKVFMKYDPAMKYSDKNLHNTPEMRKDCYNRNDSIKKCTYTLSKLSDKLYGSDKLFRALEEISAEVNTPEIILEILDRLNKKH